MGVGLFVCLSSSWASKLSSMNTLGPKPLCSYSHKKNVDFRTRCCLCTCKEKKWTKNELKRVVTESYNVQENWKNEGPMCKKTESSRPTPHSPSPPPQETRRRGRLASPSLLLLFKSCRRRWEEPFLLSRFRNQTPPVLPPISFKPSARRATVCHCQVYKLSLRALGIFLFRRRPGSRL